MPDFFLDMVLKASPFANVALAAILWFIYRSITANTTAINNQSSAMVTMSTAMDKLGMALVEVARNGERTGENQTEMIRMMERFQSAENERHNSNVNTLQSILTQVSHGGGRARA